MVDNNLHALTISGNPSEHELSRAWGEIRIEYAEKMGDNEFRLYTQVFKEISDLDVKIKMIHECVRVLRYAFVQKFADRLNNLLATNYTFDIGKIKAYDKLLDLCYNKTGGLKIRLDMLLINFKALKDKHTGQGKKPSRDYFLSLIITLSDHAQYPLSDSMTVYEFCERIIRAEKKNQMTKKALEHGRR